MITNRAKSLGIGLLGIFLIPGCAPKPIRVKPIDFTPAITKHAEESAHVAAGTAKIKAARQSLDAGRGSVGRETQGIGYVRDGLAALTARVDNLVQNAPPELRPEVDAVKSQVTMLTERTADLAQANTDAEKALEATNATLLMAQADNEAATKAHAATETALATVRDYSAKLAETANSNSTIAEAAQKSADRRGNYIGIAVGLALAAAATHMMKIAPPYSFAAPALAFPIGYFAARLLT